MTAIEKPTFAASGLPWLWVSAVLVVLDQLSKLWIEKTLVLGETIRILPVFDIVRAHNTGAAFSMLAQAGGWQRWAFSVVAVVVSALLLYWLRTLRRSTHTLLCFSLALIVGGAIGNVIDRFEHGFVVDFVQVHWGGAYFPAFNVADAGISVGAVLVALDSLREWRRTRQAKLAVPGDR